MWKDPCVWIAVIVASVTLVVLPFQQFVGDTTINSWVIALSTVTSVLAICFAISQYRNTKREDTFATFRKTLSKLSYRISLYHSKLTSSITVSEIADVVTQTVQNALIEAEHSNILPDVYPEFIATSAVNSLGDSKHLELLEDIMLDVVYSTNQLYQLPVLRKVLWDCIQNRLQKKRDSDLKDSIRQIVQEYTYEEYCNADIMFWKDYRWYLKDSVYAIHLQECYTQLCCAVVAISRAVNTMNTDQLDKVSKEQTHYFKQSGLSDSELIQQAIEGLPVEATILQYLQPLPLQTEQTPQADP